MNLADWCRRAGVIDAHNHAKNILGMNDLMGMYGVVFAAKPDKPKPVVASAVMTT
jgi:hypothetical protein